MNLYRLELKRVCKTRMTAILLAIALVLLPPFHSKVCCTTVVALPMQQRLCACCSASSELGMHMSLQKCKAVFPEHQIRRVAHIQ